jgi:TetR/AcrR family transcriptional repressor of mexJK operon
MQPVMSDTDVLSPEKHQQILRGAATIFSRDGYEGASMSRIAACAGVSKGTLYNYFASKAELFSAWVAQECERKLSLVFGDAEMNDQLESGLLTVGSRIVHMMMSPSGLTIYRLTVAEASKFPELARSFYEAGPAHATEFMTAWLMTHIEAGRLDIPDAAFAAEQFFALCQTRIGLLRRLGLMTEIDDTLAKRVVEGAVAMFLNTYGVKP